MLVQTDSDVQKAIQHLEIASKDSGLGVMCLGELTKSGSICFTLVGGEDVVVCCGCEGSLVWLL